MKKGITIVFAANIINLIFSVISSFVLPKYLSIESYGYYKVFQLYVNYLGIAHLGFADGIYLYYGGKDIKTIDSDELLRNASTLRNLQLIITAVALAISIYLHNDIAILLALSCVPINMISFYKNLYQATGEFKDYGIILSVLPIITFVCNVMLLFVAKTDNYILYILVVFFSNLVLYCILENRSRNLFGKIKFFSFDLQLLTKNIVSGITLTLGNFASILITSIDRWCIQAWMTISEFSYYSFAVSVENLFNVCVSAVTTTLYNYLCKERDREEIVRLRSQCTFTGIYLVAVAFPVKFIVLQWLSKYQSSIWCLFILIGAHSYYFVIKAIYVNLYKARGQQSHYMKQMILILAIAFAANTFAYYVVARNKEAIAFASLFTAVMWFLICSVEFRDLGCKVREILLMFASTCLYLVCGLEIQSAILGCIIYVVVLSFGALILCKNEFFEFLTLPCGFVKSIVAKPRRR